MKVRRAPASIGPGGREFARVSALTGEGLEGLLDAIHHLLAGDASHPESVVISHARHQASLQRAAQALRDAQSSIEAGTDLAATAVDIKIAAEALGEVTGETVTEATITQIFARFCVGK